ncbi:hypothetical protein ABT026_00490 [Streptomyces sp. NPDC002734]|uniref:hypothetical protein n=1 Tax=Streptomyces sp. NPDC002734 TaxID=3154426 RepID=UPI00331F1D75
MAIGLVACLTACDAPDHDDAEATPSRGKQSPGYCRGLIGAAGVEWVERTFGSKVRETARVTETGREVQPIKEAVRVFRSGARAWSPQTDADVTFRFPPTVCRLVPEGRVNPGRLVSIKAGPGDFPFDVLTDGDMENGGEVTAVGGDVKLVAWNFGGERGNENSVVVRCSVKGAWDAQINRVPIAFTMTDHLDKDANPTPRFDLLLDAARVAVRQADCLNDPKLPERAPEM